MARRAALARSLSRTTLQLARQAMQDAYPELTEEEHATRFVALCYSREPAGRFERFLARRDSQRPS